MITLSCLEYAVSAFSLTEIARSLRNFKKGVSFTGKSNLKVCRHFAYYLAKISFLFGTSGLHIFILNGKISATLGLAGNVFAPYPKIGI